MLSTAAMHPRRRGPGLAPQETITAPQATSVAANERWGMWVTFAAGLLFVRPDPHWEAESGVVAEGVGEAVIAAGMLGRPSRSGRQAVVGLPHACG